MLVLSRMRAEGITIDHPLGLIHVVVIEIRGDKVRLGITAPREVVVDRDEVAQRRKMNKEKNQANGMKNYILNDDGTCRKAELLEWACWYETAKRHIGKTTIGKVQVSTVFLGIDRQFGEGPPLLFETMIFGGSLDENQWRYSTIAEAKEGHAAAVAKVIEAIRTEGDGTPDT